MATPRPTVCPAGLVRSFPPLVAPAGARRPLVLVLGSMPGAASLAAGEYYAHPRNAFWPLWGRLVGFDPADPYALRVRALSRAGVAVWDVLASCHRVGSLDASIERGSEVANDVAGLVLREPTIRAVLLNGSLAAALWRRHAAPELPAARVARLAVARVPSTSPAHAARGFEEKLAAWRAAVPLLCAGTKGAPREGS